MRWISLGLALVSCLVTVPADAGSLSAVINGRSYHVGASKDWNENNVGFGLEYHFDTASRWRTTALANGFRDSDDRMSYIAGGSLQRRFVESPRLGGLYLDAGVTAFLMTRHDVNDNRPFPGILPTVSLGNRHVGFNLTYLPEAAVRQATNSHMSDPTIKGIFFLQMKINLDRFLPSSQ